MAQFRATIDVQGLRAFKKKALKNLAAVKRHGFDAVTAAMRKAQEIARDNVDGKVLNSRSGDLRDSITYTVDTEDRGQIIDAEFGFLDPVGSVDLYGAIHEFGGIIKPVDAEVLTVPLDNAMDSEGNKIIEPTEIKDVYGASFWRNDILFGRDGDEITPLFYAFDQIEVPEKRFLRDAIDEIEPDLLEDFVKRVLKDFRNFTK